MKKFLLFITTLSLLISCGSKKDDTVVDANTPLKFYSWTVNFKDIDQKIADEYEKETGQKVQFIYVGDMKTSEYYQKIDLMTLANEPMDIVSSSAYPEYTQRASSNAYYDISEFLNKEGINYDNEYVVSSKVDDKIYGLPGDLKFWFVLINENALKNSNLQKPSLDWTWDDFANYSNAMTKGQGLDKKYGAYFHVWDHFNYMGLWSTKLNNAILKSFTETNFDDPNFKAWLEFRTKMEKVDKSLVPYNEVKATNATYREQFFNSKAGMIPIGSWMIPEIGDQSKFPHQFKTVFAPLPRFGNNTPDGRTYVEAHYYSVSKNSKRPEQAYKFIRYYTTKGMELKVGSLSAAKGVNRMDYVKKMITNPEYYDLESLEKVVNNPNFYDNANTLAPSYQKEATNIVVEESEKYYLDQIDVDTALNNMKKRVEKLMKENQ